MTAAPVYDIGQFLDDPHVQERGIVVEAPDDEMGEVPMHARGAAAERHAGPAAHAGAGDRPAQREIYARIGYSDRAHRRARPERRSYEQAVRPARVAPR